MSYNRFSEGNQSGFEGVEVIGLGANCIGHHLFDIILWVCTYFHNLTHLGSLSVDKHPTFAAHSFPM